MNWFSRHITVLGGGPAGLAVGYYAKKSRLSFSIYEASDRIGGNAITYKRGNFYYDSGAHRLHAKDTEVTQEIKGLLGNDLKKIDLPSQIYDHGKFIVFPLSPLNLLIHLGPGTFIKAGFEVLNARLKKTRGNGSFESFALRAYGRTIAERFLLNYSEKLWGTSCNQLSPAISGKRIRGLNLRSFLTEAIFGRKAKVEHLDGTFYYPRMGYGMIAEKMAEFCGSENIHKNARITKIFHNHKRIEAIEINNKDCIEMEEVVNTLPLPLLIKLLTPQPEEGIMQLINNFRFRNIILVALFIDKDSATNSATVYFPDPELPFTRIYEPKKRSTCMSPVGKTSLVIELPCQSEDAIWRMEDAALIKMISAHLFRIGLIKEQDIIDSSLHRINYAYPILALGLEKSLSKINQYLKCFNNLKLSGRNGKFMYTHVHDMIRFGKDIVEGYVLSPKESAPRNDG